MCVLCGHGAGEHDALFRALAGLVGVEVHARGPVGQELRAEIAARFADQCDRWPVGMTLGDGAELLEEATRPAIVWQLSHGLVDGQHRTVAIDKVLQYGEGSPGRELP